MYPLPHADWVEVPTVLCSMYALYRTYGMRRYYCKLLDEAVARGENGPMLFKAQDHIYNQNYLVVMSVLIFAGAAMMLVLAPPPPDYHLLPQSVSFLCIFAALAITITLKSIGRKKRDQKLRDLLDRYKPLPGGRREYDSAVSSETLVEGSKEKK